MVVLHDLSPTATSQIEATVSTFAPDCPRAADVLPKLMAAANALCCANMALAGFDQVIPFDEVVATAKRVAEQMPREVRCTALGGLSITPTSLAIEARLAQRKAACGAGSCGCGS